MSNKRVEAISRIQELLHERILAHHDRPKTRRLLRQAGTICSSKRFDQPLLTIGFKSLGRSRQIVSARWTALREVLSVPLAGGRFPAAIATVDRAIAVDSARARYGLPSYKACNGLGCLRQSRAVSNRGGLSRENHAVGLPSPISTQPPIFRIPLLCRFFAHSFALHAHRNASNSCSTLETVEETQKMGASRGDNRVVTGLANCERAVCRVARLGGLPSGSSRFVAPQRRRWTTSFSTSPAGAARAISPAMPAPPERGNPDQRCRRFVLRMPYRVCNCEPFSRLGMLAVGASSSGDFRGPE